eukprot:g6547.t1
METHKLLFSSRRSLGLLPSRTYVELHKNRTRFRRRRFALVLKATSVHATTAPVKHSSLLEWKDDFHERFVLDRSLGHGSFGEVWLAIDRKTREKVAVKEMPKYRGRLSAEGTFAKIDREISVMRDLVSCPAAVQFKECHALPSSYKIVMEYCAGLDLKEQIRRNGPIPEQVAAYVAFEILMILKRCHENGIVHGDVKTANFILRSNECNPFLTHDVTGLTPGWLKAIDFGCSRYLFGDGRISSRVGTPVFMAPEVFDRNYGCECDLWSLGVVLYQLISGRFPFWDSTQDALTSSLDDVIDKIHVEEPDFMSSPFDQVSDDCLDFIKRLLEKDYKKRITAQEALNHPFIQGNVQHCQEEKSSKADDGNNIVPTKIGSLNVPVTVA